MNIDDITRSIAIMIFKGFAVSIVNFTSSRTYLMKQYICHMWCEGPSALRDRVLREILSKMQGNGKGKKCRKRQAYSTMMSKAATTCGLFKNNLFILRKHC